MANRPLIFSDPMVRALIRETMIEGTGKTMTRRLRRTVSPGDRIWVREAWATDAPDLDACRRGVGPDGRYGGPYFRADDVNGRHRFGGWRSPIFLPRWASRLTLTVTDVRIERLGAITEDDARREGVSRFSANGKTWRWGLPARDGRPALDDDGWPWRRWRPTARDAFIDLWDELHGPGAWDRDRDRWVQVIAFTPRLENIDAPDEGIAA